MARTMIDLRRAVVVSFIVWECESKFRQANIELAVKHLTLVKTSEWTGKQLVLEKK